MYNLMTSDISIHLWNHHHNQDTEQIHHLSKFLRVTLLQYSPSSGTYYYDFLSLYFIKFYMEGIIQYIHSSLPGFFTQYSYFEISLCCCFITFYFFSVWVFVHWLHFTHTTCFLWAFTPVASYMSNAQLLVEFWTDIRLHCVMRWEDSDIDIHISSLWSGHCFNFKGAIPSAHYLSLFKAC